MSAPRSRSTSLIDDLAAQGMAIILISSDLPEVLAMSDRILVMREGRQMAIFDHREATQERVLSAAMGQSGDLFPDDEGIDRAAGSRGDRRRSIDWSPATRSSSRSAP